jgi:WD40 repeat protein
LEHFDAISDSPNQIYNYALPFCPSSSWLKKHYTAELSQAVNVVKGTLTDWGTCLRTVTFDSFALAISYGNSIIAVGLEGYSNNIMILNAITGSQAAVLSSHTDSVGSLVFSSDGRLLVSGSDDGAVKLWDVQTGGVVKTFCGHISNVMSVSISQDCSRIVSGSFDKTICLWDIPTGECLQSVALEKPVDYVGFYPTNHTHFISCSGGKFQQWDINGHQTRPTYNASHIVFSSGYTQFALCNQESITIQNSDSGAIMAEIHLPEGSAAKCCCFSPDGSLVAVASKKTIYVWNIDRIIPCLIVTLAGHTGNITSLVFSSPSSLVSVSWDTSAKFWEIGVSSTDQVKTDIKSHPSASTGIVFVSLQAKEGIVISGQGDGVVKIWDILTGLCKTSFQTLSRENFRGDAQLIDGKLLCIWQSKDNVCFWDSERGQFPHRLDLSQSSGFRISGDGSKVFSVNSIEGFSKIQAWSTWTWELVGQVVLENGEICFLDPFHAGGSKVWVQFRDLTTRGWDFGISGSSPLLLSNPSSGRPWLDFISDKWNNCPPFLKNTVSGKSVFGLSGQYAEAHSIQWDGQYLVALYGDGEILILDFKHLCSQ